MNMHMLPIAIVAAGRSTLTPRRPRLPLLLLLLLMTPLALSLTGCGESSDPQARSLQLLEVAERGDTSALDALLRRKANADVRDSCDWTPLMKAAVNGHVDAARRLLDAGASVDAADKGGYTALLLAASNNHAELVSLLLDRGAMIDAQEDTQGYTPLIWAAHRGHTETVTVLLRRGADSTLPDRAGLSAAQHAAEQGHPEVTALLAPPTATAQAATGS
jgi:ankyrin repeat protein